MASNSVNIFAMLEGSEDEEEKQQQFQKVENKAP